MIVDLINICLNVGQQTNTTIDFEINDSLGSAIRFNIRWSNLECSFAISVEALETAYFGPEELLLSCVEEVLKTKPDE